MATIPPLPDPRVPEFSSDIMQPTWRQFWLNLLTFLGQVPNGLTLAASTPYANDAAAAAGGVPVGGFYINNTGVGVYVVQVRVS